MPTFIEVVAPADDELNALLWRTYVNCGGTNGLRHHLSWIKKTTNRIVVYGGSPGALPALADDPSATSCWLGAC